MSSLSSQPRWGRMAIWVLGMASVAIWAQVRTGATATPQPLLDEPIKPLPSVQSLNLDERKVRLGERMFMDPRLSRDGTVACVSCHQMGKGGTDGAPRSTGIRQQLGGINAPSVFNAALHFKQFWDGRADNLIEQMDGVVHNPKEFDHTWPEIVTKLSSDTGLVNDFKAVYPGGLQALNIKDAIATYERSLLTPSRFDRYLLGEPNAISADEKKGYQLFKQYGCVACHQGVAVGGNMFQKFGVFNNYFGQRGNPTAADLGRYNVTKLESDKYVFKVPSLRNVALTAPYFHDGSVTTLDKAVDVMFVNQLGRPAPAEDKQLIVQFLRSLTGEKLETRP